MRWIGIVATLAWGLCHAALGQNYGGLSYGMFGQRTLGATLQPKQRSMVGGIVTGPAGEFVGRGRAVGMTFNPSLWQSDTAHAAQAEVRARQIEARRATQAPAPPAPREMPAPASVETPNPPVEEWFRAPTSGRGSGRESAAFPAASGRGVAPASAATPTPRPLPVSLGFAASPVNYDPAASVAGLLGRTSRIARLSPISVTMERETAVLRGRVRTMRDRQLAEDLVRMEPGVWQVRNELVVGETR